jgi:hypothetical protein
MIPNINKFYKKDRERIIYFESKLLRKPTLYELISF